MTKHVTKLVVTIEMPFKVPHAFVRDYVRDAVTSWRGQLQPPGAYGTDTDEDQGDPMWYMDPDRVKISYQRKGK